MAARVDFDRAVCAERSESFTREWLETNGIGGFACSTIAGVNTRRYHGLLTSAEPDGNRWLLLSKLEETLIVGDRRYELSSNIYPGAIHPEGDRRLIRFRLDPSPVFTFEAEGIPIEKRLWLEPGENTVHCEYTTNSRGCRLEVRPLVAFRGYHDLTHANAAFQASLDTQSGLISLQPYDSLPRLWFLHNAAEWKKEGDWYFDFQYPVERERGLDSAEDLFCPFVLTFDLDPKAPSTITASVKRNPSKTRPATATTAADQFLVTVGSRSTVIAGYPWFTDWTRDALISLPGLTLARGRFDHARLILRSMIASLDQGMLPNRFPEGAARPEYNTVDGSLWFFEAVRQYISHTDDTAFARAELYEALQQIFHGHVNGTRFGIRMDSDGLLTAGDPTTQLTWMDARVLGRPVTPRNGKPVEIQALWYNALSVLAELAGTFGDQETQVSAADLAARCATSFTRLFWNPDGGCLFDVIDGEARDASLRPNQLIALSLGHCVIASERARRILEVVDGELLTPFGLRTLAPSDPRYRGRYEGPPEQRDAAYHQGTVWPWLLGPWATAQIRFHGDAGRAKVERIVRPLRSWMDTRGAGQLAEIFDGDPPHLPRGCFAQAWSVGEFLRAAQQCG